MRWYGSKFDTVTLQQMRQVPGVKGVITTLYDTKPGEVWSRERIRAMIDEVEAAGLCVAGMEAMACGVPTVLYGNEGYFGAVRSKDDLLRLSLGNFCCRGMKKGTDDDLYRDIAFCLSMSGSDRSRLFEMLTDHIVNNHLIYLLFFDMFQYCFFYLLGYYNNIFFLGLQCLQLRLALEHMLDTKDIQEILNKLNLFHVLKFLLFLLLFCIRNNYFLLP